MFIDLQQSKGVTMTCIAHLEGSLCLLSCPPTTSSRAAKDVQTLLSVVVRCVYVCIEALQVHLYVTW